nr:MAG TPA: Protein of unknown function (DUF1642) [Caudoviricetes sp.]
MNKQELIKAVIELPVDCSGTRPKIDQLTTLELTKLLDEPKKIEIPQEVADYIEFKKANDFHVYGAMRVIEDHYDKRVPEWFYEDNIEKFCLAWIQGYDIEEEKRYRISMPKARNYKNHAQFLCEKDGKMFWCAEWHRFRTKFTHKELEDADFGWVFDCPGVQIEEVK